MMALQICKIVILAAFDPVKKVAPKLLKKHHLGVMPHNSFLLQVVIDEGGNIDDPDFRTVTYWYDPFYSVMIGKKRLYVCNVPDIPGVIDPRGSTEKLVEANSGYLVEIIRTWPNVPDRYVFKGFSD